MIMGFAVFGLLFVASARLSNVFFPNVPNTISNDHTELAALTGDVDSSVNLTASALNVLGWKRGVSTRYNLGTNSRDSAMTFIKGDHCIAIFSATNDITDTLQVLGGFNVKTLPPVDMCGFQVHAGVAQEMASFLQSPAYPDFVAFLNDGQCKNVTAVGHSLGGALATLWATCANVRANISSITFGARSDYALVTFAPFAIATTAVYNGKPGVPFIGIRYGLTESDGGASARTGFHVGTKNFRIQLIELYVQIANVSGLTDFAANLANQKTQLRNMSAEAIEGLWTANFYPALFPYALYTMSEAKAATAIGEEIRAHTAKFALSGVLSYEYDCISSIGGFFGFKHALQDFQPLPNKLVVARAGSSMAKVPAVSASDLPKADLFQSLFSTLANDGWFVNHATCCYSSQENQVCALQYDRPEWRACKNKLLQLIPAATIAPTTTVETSTSLSTSLSSTETIMPLSSTSSGPTELSQAHGVYFVPISWILLMIMSHAR
jgi:hypothetical protein